MFGMRLVRPLIAVSLLISAPGFAQPLPQPTPMPAAIPAPRDEPYPGTIRLEVDATDTLRHIYRMKATIPVQGGARTTLLYPRWIPGHHSPTGRVDSMAGLVIRGGGQRLEWVRDAVEAWGFHVDVPAGVTSLEAEYQFLTGVEGGDGRVLMTEEMLSLAWNLVTLYPAGYYTRQIPVQASIKLPEGWQGATSLEVDTTNGSTVHYKPTSVEQLVDSPLFAGAHFKRVDLTPPGARSVHLNIIADAPKYLEIKPEHLEAHKAMVRETLKVFKSEHYDRYDFLLSLSDRMAGNGLEHHQSSENGVSSGYFTEWDKNAFRRDLLPHEFAHSWNGKFRRPADLWTPDLNTPMRDSLLWVYEGQTQYWGIVLAARAGLLTKKQTIDSLASTAAYYDNRPGRAWKNLQDTTNDPVTMMRRGVTWRSWQRGEDYYNEGALVWLGVDTLIRELSRGKKSLDDFAASFFGINNGSYVPVTYTFEDVVAALNAVQPHDWASFLRKYLDGHGPRGPIDGFTRGGYKLVYKDTPNDFMRSNDRGGLNLAYSLGMSIGREGRIGDVVWEGPAFQQKLTPSMQIIAVNGLAFDNDRMKEAITDAQKTHTPIELIVKDGVRFRTVRLEYYDGLRYPHLERIPGTPDRLDQILSAKK
jgi:predicted metalloprotease with PDZ domain